MNDMSETEQIIERFFNDAHPENTQKAFFLWLLQPSSSSEKDRSLYEQWDNIQGVDDCNVEASFEELTRRLGWTKRRNFRSLTRSLTSRISRIAAMFLIPLISNNPICDSDVQSQQPAELKRLELGQSTEKLRIMNFLNFINYINNLSSNNKFNIFRS
jgi:hypothetical protein